MVNFPFFKKGCFGSSLRITVLIYSFVMIAIYIATLFYHVKEGKYIEGGMSIIAIILSLSLFIGAILNRKTFLLNIYKFGFYIYVIYCIIFFIMSMINAIKILIENDASSINQFYENKQKKLTLGEARKVAIVFIIYLCVDLILDLTFYLYGLSYIKQVREEYKDRKEFKELEV